MSAVLDYPGYRKENFNPEVPVTSEGAATKLPPFYVPSQVSITVSSTGACRYVFHYLNDEPPEKGYRAFPDDADIQFRLGRHSKKIMEIVVEKVIERLESGQKGFDPRRALLWSQELPAHRQFVCTQNSEVVNRIMMSLPASLEREIKKMVRQLER